MRNFGFQDRVQAWVVYCFGSHLAQSRKERSLRFLEEALELVQAQGLTKQESFQVVDYVYDRTRGETKQEVGGVMVCLAALCSETGVSMSECGEVELERCWKKTQTIRDKQAKKPQELTGG